MPATEYPNGEFYSYYPAWNNSATTANQQGPSSFASTGEFYGSDDIVISGVSGRFPEAENIEEFSKYLYGGQFENKDFPYKQSADFTYFDYKFFGFTEKQAELMDPKLRWLFETVYESIFDSGFNPAELKGSKTGVFIGTTTSANPQPNSDGYMKYSSEISRYYEFNGPFFTYDTTQSSGLIALEKAIYSVRNGLCDQAIVGGVNFNNGSEFPYYGTVGVVFIQKSNASRRFYAKVLNAKSVVTPSTGEKDVYFTSENGDAFVKLLREVFSEVNVDPNFVTYYETHGYDKKFFESNEYKLISDIFGKNRNLPLFVGSTKSTYGYEHGMISLIKVLIAAQKGIIPASLKFQKPSSGEYFNSLQYINENTNFYGGLMALNSFGYRGTSIHIVLQPNNEQFLRKYGQNLFWNQDYQSKYYNKPHLFNFSARTEEGLYKIYEQIKLNPNDLPTQYLMNSNAYTSPATYPYRGYTVLNSAKSIFEFKKLSSDEKRPLWFFFDGFFTNWTGMGKEFMQFEYFSTTIYKIADYLKPYGFDLREFFTTDYIYVKPFYSLVTITAIQIAFVELMKYLGIMPDGIVGYSFGEFVAAYADNALSMEETILCVYHLAKLIDETNFSEASIAYIGLPYEEVATQFPQGIVPCFYESKDSVMVIGHKKAIQKFVEQFKQRGVYAKEFDYYFGVGFHSYLISAIAPKFKTKLESIIKTPKLRSPKWYTTSTVLTTESYKYASAEYFYNTLINPVYFYQAVSYMPKNAVALDFGPNSYLESYFKKTFDSGVTFINFMSHNASNPIDYFFTNFGRFYNEGFNVDPMKLFFPYQKDYRFYPVPPTAKFLSPYVSWYRSNDKFFSTKPEEFDLPKNYSFEFDANKNNKFFKFNGTDEFSYKFDVSKGSEYEYLMGHQLNGKTSFPTSGYLYMVWNAFATLKKVNYYELPVAFENVQFFYPTFYEPTTSFEMTVRFVDTFHGYFEVLFKNKVVASGRIYLPKETSVIGYQDYYQFESSPKYRSLPYDMLAQEEVYNEFKLRGYEYLDMFQGIYKCSIDGRKGELFWNAKWMPFLETMVQIYMFSKSGLQYPTRIDSIKIDPKSHGKYIKKFEEFKGFFNKKSEYKYYGTVEYPEYTGVMPFLFDEYINSYVAGGVEMSGFYSTPFPQTYYEQPVTVERVQFAPYFENYNRDKFAPEDQYTEDYEFVDSYISEIHYYLGEVSRKIEFATFEQPKPISQSSSYDAYTSYYSSVRSYSSISPASTKCFGKSYDTKFLQLLKNANKFEVDSEYLFKVKSLFADNMSFYKTWREDPIFYKTGGRYSYLKSLLDTIYENTFFGSTQMPRLKVLEISPQFYSFGPKINELFGSYPLLNIDYHYAPAGEFYPELFNEWSKQSPFPITKVDWNFKSHELPPAQYKDYDLVIFNNSFNFFPFFEDKSMIKKWLEAFSEKVVKPQGFVLVHEYVNHFDFLNQLYGLEEWTFTGIYPPKSKFQAYKYPKDSVEFPFKKYFDDFYYPTSFKQDNTFSSFYLYRKFFKMPPPPSNYPLSFPEKSYPAPPKDFEIYINEMPKFDWVDQVKEAMANFNYERIWLISEKLPTAGLIGLLNCLRYEPRGERLRSVFIADAGFNWKPQFEFIKRGDLVFNVFKYGKWGSYRHFFDYPEFETSFFKNPSTKYAYADMFKKDDCLTFEWIQSPEPVYKEDKQTLVNVTYGGLNYRDYLMATGEFNPEYLPTYNKKNEYYFGMEFSGYNNEKRYMGLVPSRGLSTVLAVDNKYLWEIPQTWTFEQAATVPFAYSQAFYALVVRGGLKQGETVLIHSGATTFGQAAISVAFGYNCKVFTTISSKEEKEFLMTRYPGKFFEESFLYFTDEYFDKQIMRYTKGKGVNVVLNWFNNESFQPSFRCMAPFGRFLDMGDYYSFKSYQYYSMPFANKNITYYTIYFDSFFVPEQATEWQNVYKLVLDGIHSGIVRPLTSNVYESYKIQEAFKYFVNTKLQFNKVLIKIGDQMKPMPEFSVAPRVYYSPFMSYIITGLTPFGLELAYWMVERGARKIVFTSSTGIKNAYQQRKIQYLQFTYGATIYVAPYDVKEESQVAMLIKEAIEFSEEKKIGGIYHLETSFTNGFFEMLKPEQFKRVYDAKYTGAYYLDKYSRKFDCYFFVFSSFVSGYGYPGSSAYAYANSAIERLCELRHQDGKHALAIQWGTIGEIESVFGTPESEIIYNGTMTQKIYSALKTFEYIFLRSKYDTVWSSYVPAPRYYPKESFSYPYESYPVPPVNQEPPFYPTPKPQPEPPVYPTPKPQPEPPVYPTPQPEFEKPSLFIYLCKLLSLNNPVSYDMPLVHYGLNEKLAGEFKAYFEKYYEVQYTISDYQQFTFEKIKSFEKSYPYTKDYPFNYKDEKFNYLVPKRLFEKLNDVEPSKQFYPLFFVCPIEGHCNMLKNFAKYMKYPVYGIQYTYEAFKYDSIENLAEYYLQQIDNEFGPETRFHLAGYSFGGCVAYEMTYRKPDRISSLSFLDCSFVYFNPLANPFKFLYFGKETYEAEFLYAFISQYTQYPARSQFIQELAAMKTFDARVDYSIQYLLKSTKFNFYPFDLEQAARSYVQRMQISYNYQPKPFLKYKEVLLVRSSQKNVYNEYFGVDYGLATYTQGQVSMQVVDGDQRSFFEPPYAYKIASYFNEYLSKFNF
jgi:fatty acid synthase